MKNIFETLFDKKHRKMTVSYGIVVLAYLIIELLIKTNNLSFLLTSLLVPTCCYIMVALALNLVVGFSGDLSLGHAAFMGIGAFVGISISNYVYFLIPNDILRVIVAIVIGAISSGILGYLISIPVLKLSGDYLAIVTLAFCQIIKSLLNNVYLGFDNSGIHFSFINQSFTLNGGKMLINGPVGSTGNTKFSNFTVAIIMVLLTLTVVFNMMHSKYGRAIMASRDNSIAASSVGINVTKAKTLCFVLSSIIAGAAGGLYALNYTTLTPAKFDFNLSIMILVYVVLGGLGNVSGTIISTTILVLLPELLRSVSDYRMIAYALVLILIMLISNNDSIKNFYDSLKNRFKIKDKKNV